MLFVIHAGSIITKSKETQEKLVNFCNTAIQNQHQIVVIRQQNDNFRNSLFYIYANKNNFKIPVRTYNSNENISQVIGEAAQNNISENEKSSNGKEEINSNENTPLLSNGKKKSKTKSYKETYCIANWDLQSSLPYGIKLSNPSTIPSDFKNFLAQEKFLEEELEKFNQTDGKSSSQRSDNNNINNTKSPSKPNRKYSKAQKLAALRYFATFHPKDATRSDAAVTFFSLFLAGLSLISLVELGGGFTVDFAKYLHGDEPDSMKKAAKMARDMSDKIIEEVAKEHKNLSDSTKELIRVIFVIQIAAANIAINEMTIENAMFKIKNLILEVYSETSSWEKLKLVLFVFKDMLLAAVGAMPTFLTSYLSGVDEKWLPVKNYILAIIQALIALTMNLMSIDNAKDYLIGQFWDKDQGAIAQNIRQGLQELLNQSLPEEMKISQNDILQYLSKGNLYEMNPSRVGNIISVLSPFIYTFAAVLVSSFDIMQSMVKDKQFSHSQKIGYDIGTGSIATLSMSFRDIFLTLSWFAAIYGIRSANHRSIINDPALSKIQQRINSKAAKIGSLAYGFWTLPSAEAVIKKTVFSEYEVWWAYLLCIGFGLGALGTNGWSFYKNVVVRLGMFGDRLKVAIMEDSIALNAHLYGPTLSIFVLRTMKYITQLKDSKIASDFSVRKDGHFNMKIFNEAGKVIGYKNGKFDEFEENAEILQAMAAENDQETYQEFLAETANLVNTLPGMVNNWKNKMKGILERSGYHFNEDNNHDLSSMESGMSSPSFN